MTTERRTTYAKVEADHRLVIPRVVRRRLGLRPGDLLRIVLDAAAVRIERATPPIDDCFATFTEWASEADDHAYSDL